MERKKRRAQVTAGSCDITAASSFEQRKAGLAEAGTLGCWARRPPASRPLRPKGPVPLIQATLGHGEAAVLGGVIAGILRRAGRWRRSVARGPDPRFCAQESWAHWASPAAVAGLIDWIEEPRSDQSRPCRPTAAVVETLRFLLCEGVQ